MDYLEQNKRCLEKYHYNLYEKLYPTEKGGQVSSSLENEINKSELDQIYFDIAKNGEKVLFIEKGKQKFRMNSSYNPSHEASCWAEQFKFRSFKNIIAIFGFGSGIMIEKMMDRLSEDDFLIIYEPSGELFKQVMRLCDLTKILSFKSAIITIEKVNEFEFHQILQYITDAVNIKTQVRCVLPYYEELFPESCVAFWKELRDIMMHTVININTEVSQGTKLLENAFHNLRYLKESYTLQGIAPFLRKDRPAIIVAAGPSVKDNLEELKRAKGKAYLFVVDRVLDFVLDNGIEPDFVVTVDPAKPVEYFTNRERIEYPMLTELASNKDILERHKGKKIVINCDWFFKSVYEKAGVKPPQMNTGASVATVAFSACIQLGFDKIVLVGQDLAYDGEMTHAGGIAEDPSKTVNVMIEGIDGNKVSSRYDWKEFAIWFKDMIYLHPEITVFDTKKKGAKIQGAVLKSLEEILDEYATGEDCSTQEVFNESNQAFHNENYTKALNTIAAAERDLKKIKKRIKKAIGISEQQIKLLEQKKGNDPVAAENYDEITKINKYIECKEVYHLIDIYIASLTMDDITTMYHLNEESCLDGVVTYQKTKKIYEAILKAIDFIQTLFDEWNKRKENAKE